jgi:hypothetical protein
MKKLVYLLGLILLGVVQTTQAQDTITVELSSKAKIVIFTKDKEGLDLVRKLDLNQIIREVTNQLDTNQLAKTSEAKVYEYEFNTEKRTLDLRTESELNRPDTVIVRNNYQYRSQRRFRTFWNVDLGFNNYLQNGKFPDESGQSYALSPIGSRYLGLGTYVRTRVGGQQSPFSFQTGIEVNWYNFVFLNNTYISRTPTGVEFRDYQTDFQRGLNKSKLTVTYLTIPVNLNVRFRDKFGRSTFKFGAGAYAGYRVDAYSKQKFERNPERIRSNFYLSNWRYGLEAQAGYRNFLLFFRYDLNPLFVEGQGPDLNAFAFGIRI